ncbi:PREDICTED: uncharacterized protein LOC109166739 [Ipomoea nil]|uniref:uncharacterized protein LOC109166739 n=1 Tax=Ipomoea nil TaxID=35883 RepID=UPI000900CF17|nr:PREDICTED: uncharacterized protein LOC109166739 [Ipomoea nil]
MASVWRPVMGMRVIPLEDNLFAFQFPHLKDLQRVLDERPWSFENQTLVCKQVPAGEAGGDSARFSGFWVQIHELPTVYATSEFVEQVGRYVGTYPNIFGGAWRSYFRVRIALNIGEPLKRNMKLQHRNGTFQWITFKYERLNIFCLCCGLIGHSEKFCHKVYEQGLTAKDFPYALPTIDPVLVEELQQVIGEHKRR